MRARLLVLLYLFHHIEGVCKPWSAATQAARAALAKLAASIIGRDDAAAVARAEAVAEARQARALSRAIPQRPAVSRPVSEARTASSAASPGAAARPAAAPRPRPAIGPASGMSVADLYAEGLAAEATDARSRVRATWRRRAGRDV